MPSPPARKFEHAGWCDTHYSPAADCSCCAEAQQSAYDRGWNEAVEAAISLSDQRGDHAVLLSDDDVARVLYGFAERLRELKKP